MTQPDVIIIGGGIVGAAAAYECAHAGLRTLLLDRADRGRATDAGAGIVSPLSTRYELGEAWCDLALAAAQHYPPLIEALAATGQQDTGYAPCGLLLVASDEDELMPFENAARHLRKRLAVCGYEDENLQRISSNQAQALFPPLRAPPGVLHNRLAARVDGRKMAHALQGAAAFHGAVIVEESVQSILRGSDGTAQGVATSGATYRAGRVILAGGAWSAAFGEQLNLPLPIVPQRGQIAHIQLPAASAPPTEDWPIVSGFRGHYLVPWPGQRIAAGATRESGTGFDFRQTAGGIAEVLREALRVAPGLADATFLELRIGFRPATPDGLPVLGEVPGTPNLFLATGHGASGLQLGPYSGLLAARWARGEALSEVLAPFSATRFGDSVSLHYSR